MLILASLKTSLFASSISHLPASPTTQAHHTRWEHRSSLADMNADGLPHGFEVARSCVGKCLSAHRAMWQPQARILEPNGKRSSMASSTLFRRSTQWIHQICLESVGFFPRNGPKDNHEIKDLINSFYTICIKIFGCLSKNPYLKNHQKKKHPRHHIWFLRAQQGHGHQGHHERERPWFSAQPNSPTSHAGWQPGDSWSIHGEEKSHRDLPGKKTSEENSSIEMIAF